MDNSELWTYVGNLEKRVAKLERAAELAWRNIEGKNKIAIQGTGADLYKDKPIPNGIYDNTATMRRERYFNGELAESIWRDECLVIKWGNYADLPRGVAEAKWCSYCKKSDHNDDECWCTRIKDNIDALPVTMIDLKTRIGSIASAAPILAPVDGKLTTDPNDPDLGHGTDTEKVGQNKKYLVLSEEERAKGFVRPVRRAYKHVGIRPKYPLRPLTQEEEKEHEGMGYTAYEEYPEEMAPLVGKFWTAAELNSGCGHETRMGIELCETYARDPSFYGSTYCTNCMKHLPVAEFIWVEGGEVVGS